MFKELCQQLHLDFVCGNKASEQAKCLIAQIDDANNYLLIITGSEYSLTYIIISQQVSI